MARYRSKADGGLLTDGRRDELFFFFHSRLSSGLIRFLTIWIARRGYRLSILGFIIILYSILFFLRTGSGYNQQFRAYTTT